MILKLIYALFIISIQLSMLNANLEKNKFMSSVNNCNFNLSSNEIVDLTSLDRPENPRLQQFLNLCIDFLIRYFKPIM